MKATLSNYRQAPRKMGVVVKGVNGKSVVDALAILDNLQKKASGPLKKMIKSAVANARAKDPNIDDKNLIIKSMTVTKGITFKRWQPAARGSAHPIHKHSSHVKVELIEK